MTVNGDVTVIERDKVRNEKIKEELEVHSIAEKIKQQAIEPGHLVIVEKIF